MSCLGALIGNELRTSHVGEPLVDFGQAGQSKKGEDFTLVKTQCCRVCGEGTDSTFSVFAIFDGHNGRAAAIYSRDHILDDVLGSIPPGLSRGEWSAALPRALVAGFVKTDKEFQYQEQSSGSTVTVVVIDGWTVTVASVGDSRCIIESQGVVSLLTVDHRLEVNEEERQRVRASGGEVGRLSTVGGAEIGPLRCWPGGLCLSRSIGDMDVGEFIVPIPFVKQVKVCSAGGRLVLASDGVWDALSSEKAAKCCRGLSAELAAKQVVKESLRCRGLRDDTTCLVVDICPPTYAVAPTVRRKKNSRLFTSFLHRQPAKWRGKFAGKPEEGHVLEELFEEGSASLSERLGPDALIPGDYESLVCSACELEFTPSNNVVHNRAVLSTWKGPLLCINCKQKQDEMNQSS